MPRLPDNLTYEIVMIQADNIEPDRLIWRRYKRPCPGITEFFLAANPHIMPHLGQSPFLPFGVPVRIPIDQETLHGKPKSAKFIRLYGPVE
jgi:phage tail protein X